MMLSDVSLSDVCLTQWQIQNLCKGGDVASGRRPRWGGSGVGSGFTATLCVSAVFAVARCLSVYRRLRFSSDADIVRLTNARIIIIIIICHVIGLFYPHG